METLSLTKKGPWLLFFLLFIAMNVSAQNESLSALYQRLDEVIENSPKYVAQKEAGISKLKASLNEVRNMKAKYAIDFHIYEEYRSFKNDSSLAYLKKCINLAVAMKDKASYFDCVALQALMCSTAGMYSEALSLLGEIDKSKLDNNGLGDYYIAYNHVYGEMAYYTNQDLFSQRYYKKADRYRDSMYIVLDPNSETYLMKKESELTNQHNYAEALKINDRRLAMVKDDTHEYAIVAYYRYLIYRGMKNNDLSNYWLAKSAICDVENAIMDQASLWTLAHNLSDEGDVTRSFRYITFAWNAAKTYGARVRSLQISPILGAIDNTYQKQIKESNTELRIFIIAISLMALMFLLLLYYVNRQRSHLAVARNDLHHINEKLEGLNNKLSGMNDELDSTNHKLSDANNQLNESNRVKEEYIGQFLGLCSLNIDKMDKFRLQVNRMVKNHEFDDLFRLTKDTEFKEKELDELYANFDTVFLHLFPNFVSDLNSLLKEDYQIKLSDPKKLTTPLRVFALIRLGVEDSTKIAEFLHYSVNTIYNYRAKLRNGAIGDRNEFEPKVKELGIMEDLD